MTEEFIRGVGHDGPDGPWRRTKDGIPGHGPWAGRTSTTYVRAPGLVWFGRVGVLACFGMLGKL